VFDPDKLDAYDYRKNIPGSSSPYKIYRNLKEDIDSKDLHSSKIKENRAGLKKGATIMLENNLIDENDYARIIKIIDIADVTSFTPLLYIIPSHLVDNRIEVVDVENLANPLSSEFQIKDLEKQNFEILEL